MIKKGLILLFFMAVLCGCVLEKYDSDSCADGSRGPFYLALQFVPQGNSAETKAGNNLDALLRHGSLDEMLVANVDVYFYDNKGDYLGFAHMGITDGQQTEGATSPEESYIGGQVIGPLNYRPYKMLVMANLSSAQQDLFKDKDLDDAIALYQDSASWLSDPVDITYQGVTYAGRKPFVMTAGSYMNNVGTPICDIAITERNLKHKEEDAAASKLDVYLERMAAKVTLQVKQQGSEPTPQLSIPVVTARDNVTAKVEILGWALNATNNSSYYLKHIDKNWNFSWKWNNDRRYRSYWAKDTNYSPDNTPADYTFSSWDGITNTLTLDGGYFKGSECCLENTSEICTKATMYSRTTHILVKAKFVFGLSSGTDDDHYTDAEADIYRYNGVFYTASNLTAQTGKNPGDAGVTLFPQGQMYYKVPIEHLGGWDGTGDSYGIGTYGVVRNHVYEITISGIGGVGSPRPSDTSAAIVPTPAGDDHILSLYCKAAPWTQFVQSFVFIDPRSGAVYFDVTTTGQDLEDEFDDDNDDWY